MIPYKTKPKRTLGEESFTVTIVGDSNDADYITEIQSYDRESFENYVLHGLNDLYKKVGRSGKLSNYGNEFDLPLPYADYGLCHSLESVTVEYTDENGVVWDVEIEYEKVEGGE